MLSSSNVLGQMDLSKFTGNVFLKERVCHKHHELVTDVCLFTGDCKERFLCDECREVHDDEHMKYLEHFDIVFSDLILDKITRTIRLIEEKHEQAVLANRDIIDKVENIFKELQDHVNRTIAEAKNKTMENVFYLLTGNASNMRDWNRLKTELSNLQKSLSNDDENSALMTEYVKIYYEGSKRLRYVKYNQHTLNARDDIIKVNDSVLEQSFQSINEALDHLTQNIVGDVKGMQQADVSKNKLVCKHTLQSGGSGVNWGGLAYTKKFNYLVRGGVEGDIKIWDASTYSLVKSFRAHHGWINTVIAIDEINKIASAGEDNYIRLWDLNDNFRASALSGHTSVIFALEYLAEEGKLVSAGAEPNIKVWNLMDYRVEYELSTLDQSNIGSLKHIKNRKLLAAGSYDGSILLFDVKQRSLVKRIVGHAANNLVLALAYSEKDNLLVSGSMDGTMRVWKLDSVESVYQIAKQKVGAHVDSLCYLEGQDAVAASVGNKNLKFYEIQSGQSLYQLDAYDQRGRAVIYIKEHAQVITADYDNGLLKVFGFDV